MYNLCMYINVFCRTEIETRDNIVRATDTVGRVSPRLVRTDGTDQPAPKTTSCMRFSAIGGSINWSEAARVSRVAWE